MIIKESKESPQQFDIFKVNFVYQEDLLSDNPRSKVRPALLIKLRENSSISPYDFAMITSKKSGSNDYEIQDWKEAGLSTPSYIRFLRIAQFDKSVTDNSEYVGRLSQRDIDKIKSMRLIKDSLDYENNKMLLDESLFDYKYTFALAQNDKLYAYLMYNEMTGDTWSLISTDKDKVLKNANKFIRFFFSLSEYEDDKEYWDELDRWVDNGFLIGVDEDNPGRPYVEIRYVDDEYIYYNDADGFFTEDDLNNWFVLLDNPVKLEIVGKKSSRW